MADYVELTDDNFEQEVIKSDKPVMIDIWAPWCAPCRFVSPIIEQIAVEYKDKIKVGKLNVDEHKVWASKFGVEAIPTLFIFKDGKLVQRFVGAAPKQEIENLIKPYIGED